MFTRLSNEIDELVVERLAGFPENRQALRATCTAGRRLANDALKEIKVCFQRPQMFMRSSHLCSRVLDRGSGDASLRTQ